MSTYYQSMDYRIAKSLLFMSIIVQFWFTITDSTASIHLDVNEFSDHSNRLYNGECCEPSLSCSINCSLVYIACFNSSSEDESCSQHTAFTSYKTPFHVAHKLDYFMDTYVVKVIVYDVNWQLSSVIDYFQFKVNSSWSFPANLSVTGQRTNFATNLHAVINLMCDLNYYGPQCSTYCMASDNCAGHYVCNMTSGSKICLPGWMGDDCSTANNDICPNSELFVPSLSGSTCMAVDIVFVLQCSDSSRFQAFAKNVTTEIIDTLHVDATQYQISVVTFSDVALHSIKLKDLYNKEELKRKVSSLSLSGSLVNLRRGLSVARCEALSIDNGMRPLAFKAIVVVWSGQPPNQKFGTLVDEASQLRNMKDVISVTVVSDAWTALAEDIASDSAHIFINGTSKFLAGTISTAIQLDCSRITLSKSRLPTSQTAQPLLSSSQEKSSDVANYITESTQSLDTPTHQQLHNVLQNDTVTSSSMQTQRSQHVFTKIYNQSISQSLPKQPSLLTVSSYGASTIFPIGFKDPYCSDHGICNSLDGSAGFCCCEPGRTGDHCEYPADPCSSQPCQFGHCITTASSFYCICPPGISGVNCETVGSTVSSCFTSVSDLSIVRSLCLSLASIPCVEFNYSPPNCSIFCKPTESCADGHYSCNTNGTRKCLTGWTGINCTISTNNSSECSCHNGATWFNGTCYEQSDTSVPSLSSLTSLSSDTTSSALETSHTAATLLLSTHLTEWSQSVSTATVNIVTTAARERTLIEKCIDFIQANFPTLSSDEQLQLLAILLENFFLTGQVTFNE